MEGLSALEITSRIGFLNFHGSNCDLMASLSNISRVWNIRKLELRINGILRNLGNLILSQVQTFAAKTRSLLP